MTKSQKKQTAQPAQEPERSSTTGYRARRSTPAEPAEPRGATQKKTKSTSAPSTSGNRVDDLILATRPLLELFSVVDDVCTEEGLFDPDLMRASLGRIYRAWEAVRIAFDPEFDKREHRRARDTRATMRRSDETVFRSRSRRS